jgi:hypothetical protein
VDGLGAVLFQYPFRWAAEHAQVVLHRTQHLPGCLSLYRQSLGPARSPCIIRQLQWLTFLVLFDLARQAHVSVPINAIETHWLISQLRFAAAAALNFWCLPPGCLPTMRSSCAV